MNSNISRYRTRSPKPTGANEPAVIKPKPQLPAAPRPRVETARPAAAQPEAVRPSAPRPETPRPAAARPARGRRPGGPPRRGQAGPPPKPSDAPGQPRVLPVVAPIERNTLRVIPIGGLEEVGRNCTVFEYNDDIIVVDMGIQFPEEDMHGIDFIIPNLSYLRGKERKIRGVFITHGHLDHTGAIPYLMPKIGNPPLYAAPLTAGLIMKRQEEFPRAPKLKIIRIDSTKKVPIGKHFVIEPFHVNHNISDAYGLAIHTPIGTIIHTGDFKFDYTPVDEKPADIGRIAALGNKGVLAMLADSTNALSPGYQISEMTVGEGLEQIISVTKGRLIIGTFSSLLTRLQQILDLAAKYNRRVLLIGRSLQSNVEIAHQLGYMKFKKGVLMEEHEFNKMPDNKVIVVCPGAQGESNAALARIANDNDRVVSLKPGDTVIFSSSVIPGNERTIAYLQDTLTRRGAKVINTTMLDVHAGGHAKAEDLKLLLRLIQPKYLIPVHGQRTFLVRHAELGVETGVKPENALVVENGQIVEFTKDHGVLTNKKVPSDYVFVDGLGVGDVSHIILRERQAMAEEGMFVIIATVDQKHGHLVGNPEIISRGFMYMADNQELLNKVCMKVKMIFKETDRNMPAYENYIKDKIRNEVGQYLYGITRRRPMVLPVLIDV